MSENATHTAYEIMLLFSPDLSEDAIKKEVESLKKEITDASGAVSFEDFWGRRKLAYPVKKYEEGSYVVLLFTFPSDKVDELEQELLLNKSVLRHLISKTPQNYSPVTGGEVEASEDLYFEELRAKKAPKPRRGQKNSSERKSNEVLSEKNEEESIQDKKERKKKLDAILSDEMNL